MSWYSKVAWKEGLFLRPQHLQQSDRYFENQLDLRSRYVDRYPWGFASLKINRAMTEQNKFALLEATGIFPDGTPFDMPDTDMLPSAIDIPETAAGLTIWLTLPERSVNGREVGLDDESTASSRYLLGHEKISDSAASMQMEQGVDIAHPRIEIDIRKTPKPGYHCLKIAQILEVQGNSVIFDDTFAPPVLLTDAHPIVAGWIERVIGWVDTKLESLSRYAADASSGGGLQANDYFMLLLLNREVNGIKHLRESRYVHPADVYQTLMRLAGELWTFDPSRLAPDYPPYDQDDLKGTFDPILRDIQRLLSRDVGRAVRLELEELRTNSFVAKVADRNLFRNASFVVEVSANLPLTQIQAQFPELCKVGPNTRMNDIVHNNLPGLSLVHTPTPPRQIRTVSSHVYFFLDKKSQLWGEFSNAPAIAMHFAGTWPELKLELWAIMEAE